MNPDILYYLRHTLAAIFGAVLVPIATFLATLKGLVTFAVLSIVDFRMMLVVISAVTIALAAMLVFPPLVIEAAIITALQFAQVLTAAIILISAVRIFEGIEIGWNGGFRAVLNEIYNLFEIGHRSPREEEAEPRPGSAPARAPFMLDLSSPERTAVSLQQMRLRLDENSYQYTMRFLRESGLIPNIQPTSAEYFSAMELSLPERLKLVRNRPVMLTAEEIARLKDLGDEDIKDHLDCYQDLLRLPSDKCAISQDRPERQDTILFVKQYQQGESWLPVPRVSHIFGKEDLKHWLISENEVHPLTRDKITAPSRFEVGKVSYPARYVFHNYYLDNSPDGFSQEVNLVGNLLREALAGLELPLRNDVQPAPIAMCM